MRRPTSFMLVLGFGWASGCGPGVSREAHVYDSRFGAQTELEVFRVESARASSLPAVMLVHGGGWREGSRSQLAGLAQRLAAQGYVAATVSYRLGLSGAYPAAANDVRCALTYLQSHATALGLDAHRVVMLGYSAGGHLASLVATAPLAPDCAEGAGARPVGVIAAAAPQNLVALSWAGDVQRFMSGPIDAQGARYTEASPLAHVHASQPPFLLIHGDADAYVPAGQAIEMRDALIAAGNDARLLLLSGGGHVINPGTSADQLSYERYVSDSDEAWLAMTGFLERVTQ